MKPKLRYSGEMWECFADGVHTIAFSKEDAYNNWVDVIASESRNFWWKKVMDSKTVEEKECITVT